MRLLPVLCLMLLSPGIATLRRFRSREMKKGKDPSAGAATVPSNKDFAFDLYRALASAASGQNIFFSPMSVSMSLAMLSLGAGSHSKMQILGALGLGPHEPENQLHEGFQQLLQGLGQPREDFQLSLGNAFFSDPAVGVLDSFLNTIKKRYLADTFLTDFGDPTAAQKQINDYVSRQTQGKIVDLIQNLDSTHLMVMVNYVFFKAKWETAFSRKSTRQQDFHVSPGAAVQVPMMSREDEHYYFLDRNLSCSVVGVPYQGNATALFVLPSEGKMQQVENGLSQKTLRKWLQLLTKRQLKLYIPKFSIEGSYQLEKILPALGIRDVFTSHADLSGITTYPNIQLSEMIHKAVMEVDEAGTRAAAATGVMFMFKSARPTVPKVIFNRPFLIVIIKSSNILFLSKVVHP
uniref:plasma serine protease inhibitor n=1 Tax=Jaculus jaculus TaxID=51337 RepID=UPI001E1B04B8|nr:plasma serine protease inhibitor [Jaculus jaculus]